MAKVKSSKDLIMLLLYAKGHKGKRYEPIRGRTRLMKMVFLFEKEVRRKFNLEKEIPDDAMPVFTPYDYGPFSPQVFSDLEFLVELGFVEVRPVDHETPLLEETLEYEYWQAGAGSGKEEEFSLSKLGIEFVNQGEIGILTKEQWKSLDEFKARCTGVDLRRLLRYVYDRYPNMATKSNIREEILREYPY